LLERGKREKRIIKIRHFYISLGVSGKSQEQRIRDFGGQPKIGSLKRDNGRKWFGRKHKSPDNSLILGK
jgi:hypothetical protein